MYVFLFVYYNKAYLPEELEDCEFMYNIRLTNINKFYCDGENKVEIIRNMNLDIGIGDIISITGSSGIGKSTLLRIIGFLESINSGEYILNNKPIDLRNDNKLAKYREQLFGYIPQNHTLIEKMSVFHNIAMPLYIRNCLDKTIEERVYDISSKLRLEPLLKNNVDNLSLGEKQRISIARALVKRPKFLLADEPTSSLDMDNKKIFVKLVEELYDMGTAVIIITHDDYIMSRCNSKFKIIKGILEEL